MSERANECSAEASEAGDVKKVECKMCSKRCTLSVAGGELIGAGCPRGKEYAVLAGLLPEE